MKTVHDYLTELWYEKFSADFPDDDFARLRKTEWSEAFETLMRNRLVIGALRYGRMGSTGKPQYDRISAAKKRLARYLETGNVEMLVDVANFMMLEFVEGPKKSLYVDTEIEKVRKK